MNTKICTKCRTEKPANREFFYVKKELKSGFSSWCKECKKALDASRSSRREVREKANKHRTTRKTVNKQYVWSLLAESSCVDCGESNPLVLDFDHINGDKLKGVSQLMGEGYSLETIKDEITKCEIRCANCHRIKTLNERGSHKLEYFKNLPQFDCSD